MMRIAGDTAPLAAKFGIYEAVSIFAEAGLSGLDFSMFDFFGDENPLVGENWEAEARRLRAHAEGLGISFVQGHAPFPTLKLTDTEEKRRHDMARVIRAIEVAGVLGIEKLVVHPITGIADPVLRKTKNMELYRSLLPHAEKAGVVLCLENMWNYDPRRDYIIPDACSFGAELADWCDELGSPYITVCLDVGHSSLVGEEAEDAIRAIGRRLGALHIHDNDYKSDAHLLPYAGKMHWDAIAAALREVGYKGHFTFEACSFVNPLPADRAVCVAAMALMAALGRSLVEKIIG